MKLKTIKNKKGNPEYNKCLKKEVALIKKSLKKKCGLESGTVFFLGHYKFREIFLINGTIYISSISRELDSDKSPINSTMDLCELYKITLKKDYPKNLDDISFDTIIQRSKKYKFSPQEFLKWINEPSEVTENIDNPYYEVIKYLNSYSKNLFKTDGYLFYPKADGDSNFITNLYAYDINNQLEMKIYIPDKWEEIKDIWTLVAPSTVKDIVIDDLGQNVSNYQKLKCKKEFLKLANEIHPYFKTKNFWVMELLKQTIQPVDILHEWSCHRCFCDVDFYGAIWVHDFLNKNEEPYFFITDSPYLQDTTKIAVLNFKNPKYHYRGIFKKDNVKRNGWELSEKEINELIEFLNKPSDTKNEYCGGILESVYKKYVKKYGNTNWQKLIFEYNHNTAGWGWGDNGFDIPPEEDKTQYEALPFNLAIPDYTKLLEN